MAIPKINEEDITAAIKYIEENGVPEKNKSSRYVLVTEEGKQYPPKYVIAVANHLGSALSSVLSTQQPPLTTDSSVISRPVSVAINTRSPPESTRKSPFRSGMENTTLSPARYERTMVFRRSICCWELVSASQNGRHGVKS